MAIGQEHNQELGQFIPLHYHFQLLANRRRMQAFREAIELAVRTGMVVADLGSGTGVLSFLAARQNARMYAIDMLPELVDWSRRLLGINGVAQQVTVYQGDATDWLPPEPADVVLCEMLHSALLRERQIDVINAFRAAHRSRFGRVPCFLPEATFLSAQPVEQQYDFEGYVAPIPLFQPAYTSATGCSADVTSLLYASVDYSRQNEPHITAELEWQVPVPVRVNALRLGTRSVLASGGPDHGIEWANQDLLLPLELDPSRASSDILLRPRGDRGPAGNRGGRVVRPGGQRTGTVE
jgi:predicted RNA methylase